MLQRLPIALTQIKAGNTSESLLNEFNKCNKLKQNEYYVYEYIWTPLTINESYQIFKIILNISLKTWRQEW